MTGRLDESHRRAQEAIQHAIDVCCSLDHLGEGSACAACESMRGLAEALARLHPEERPALRLIRGDA